MSVFRKITTLACALLISVGPHLHTHASDIILPDLGGASNGLISPAQEYELGQQWLKIYRSQVITSSDPFLQEYLENLIRQISFYSELQDKRLDILVINNPTLNAFAVPGGIIGVHTGLFKYAETEQQFSSVIAHELAHISQRHYARKLLDQKESSIPTLAALLASILIAATAGGEAGLAAITATQAAAIESQLRFSREMEQEADRVGMDTMLRADMNPFAMSEMFEHMQSASKFQRRPPEFLLSHPLTEKRISDAALRAQQYKRKHYAESLDYQLAKVRALLAINSNNRALINTYKAQVEKNSFSTQAARYGLALVYMRDKQFKLAHKEIDQLIEDDPKRLNYKVVKAQISALEGDRESAIEQFRALMEDHPNSHPLNIRFAEALMEAGQYSEAETLLVNHSQRRPKDDYIWYLLAEVHGLTGDIYHVHTARAEYFLLNGLFEKSEIQLKNALQLVKDNKFKTAKLEQKLIQVRKLREQTMSR